MKKSLSFLLLLLVFTVSATVVAEKASALTMLNASASATTSRPSPSSPLSTDYASGVSNVTVMDNLSTFLASDSAVFFGNGTQEYLRVATTSADKLTVFFTGNTSSAHNRTGVLAAPVTAMHTIVFTTQTAIPIGGQIEIAYPTSSSVTGADTNQASPSAATWMFNGLLTSNIKQKLSQSTATCTWALSGVTNGLNGQTPKATCTTAGATIPAGTTIWVFLGCSTLAGPGTSCQTQAPTIINPTSITARGTSDVKSINVTTYSSSGGSILDSTTLKMGTIESVFVVAHVDPTFSFNIDGVAASTDMDSSSTYCGTAYADNIITGSFPSTGTEVNLGTITSGGESYAAQKFTVTSNTGVGYAITATSSGFLVNPPTGKYIVNAQGNVTANNTPAPATISSTTGGYGITACDSVTGANSRVSSSIWGDDTTTPKFANPSPSFYYTLVNYAGTPASSGDNIYVIYAARAAGDTPPGDYWQIITYTASVTF